MGGEQGQGGRDMVAVWRVCRSSEFVCVMRRLMCGLRVRVTESCGATCAQLSMRENVARNGRAGRAEAQKAGARVGDAKGTERTDHG